MDTRVVKEGEFLRFKGKIPEGCSVVYLHFIHMGPETIKQLNLDMQNGVKIIEENEGFFLITKKEEMQSVLTSTFKKFIDTVVGDQDGS